MSLVTRPRGAAKRSHPVVGRLVSPDVVLRMLAEPSVLDGGVRRDEVEEQAQAAIVRARDESVEAVEVTQLGRDRAVVGHVVPHVGEGRRVDRREPERVDSEVHEVVEPRLDAGQIADPVAVRVLERARIDLVDDGVVPRYWMSALPRNQHVPLGISSLRYLPAEIRRAASPVATKRSVQSSMSSSRVSSSLPPSQAISVSARPPTSMKLDNRRVRSASCGVP